MKKQPKPYLFYLGILAFAIGLLLQVLFADVGGVMESFSFALTGFGAGLIGVGVVNLLRIRRWKSDPEKAKQLEIEAKDERNILIREKAGLAAWYVSLFTLVALIFTFVALGNMLASTLSLAVLAIHILSLIIFIRVYNKKL